MSYQLYNPNPTMNYILNNPSQASQPGKVYPSNFIGPIRPQDSYSNPIYNTPSKPQVQGTSTTISPGGGSNPQPSQPSSPSQPDFDPYASLRNDISSGWDQYISSLNSQLEGLNGQRTAQEDIANSQYNQGINNLDLQKTQGLQGLGAERDRIETNQTKTLRDLTSNLRNSFMAGNVYLGARGAGDSSAANQYSLALTKEGSRQRGDIMQQGSDQLMEIGRREENLNNIYNTETKNLLESKNQALSQIAQWFSNAQNQIRQAQAQGQLGKSQDLQALSKDILNQAIAKMNQVEADARSQRSALDQWAVNNSTSINQLKANLQSIGQYSANLPGFSPIAGAPRVDSNGNIVVATGYGSTNRDKLLGQ